MKKILFIFVLNIFILFTTGCNQNDRVNTKQEQPSQYTLLKKYIDNGKFGNFENIKKYIILNEEGCVGCVSIAVNSILKEFQNYKDTVAVIAVYQTRVIPREISILLKKYKDVYLDSNGLFNEFNIAPHQSSVIIPKDTGLEIIDVVEYYRGNK